MKQKQKNKKNKNVLGDINKISIYYALIYNNRLLNTDSFTNL